MCIIPHSQACKSDQIITHNHMILVSYAITSLVSVVAIFRSTNLIYSCLHILQTANTFLKSM